MTLFCKLSRKHYWCIPHRGQDNRLVQVCYECGAERLARELHTEPLPEGVRHTVTAVSTNLTSVRPRPAGMERPQIKRSDNHIAVSRASLNRLTLVK